MKGESIMECRTVMAVMIDKRIKEAVKVQETLTRHGCIIGLRIGLHETANVCADNGLIILSLCGTKKEVAALKKDLGAVKGVKTKSMEL
jgi:Iron-only hydrogenase system regulator, putative